MVRKFFFAFLVLCLCALSVGAAFAAMSDEDFMELCEKGSPQQIGNAIKNGANANAYGEGRTPLMCAAEHNPNPEVVTTLVKAGADIDGGDEGVTPLAVAASNNSNPEMITALVKAGADVNARNCYGGTPLMWAAENNSNPEVITTLLKFGADPKMKDDEGKMAIDYARDNEKLKNTNILAQLGESKNTGTPEKPSKAMSDGDFLNLCARGSPQQISNAIKNGANVNAYAAGWNPLMFAASYNPNPEVITTLAKAGVDVNARVGVSGLTPLMEAVGSNPNPKVITALLKAGADVNAKDTNNMTSLMRATTKPNIEVMKILLDNGANLEGVEKYLLYEEEFNLLCQYPEGQKYFDNLIEAVKNSYWGDYSAKDGYEPLGEAFENFFSKPKWGVSNEAGMSSGVGKVAVVFTGVAKWNNRNAMFKVLFTVDGRSVRGEKLTINGINGNKSDWNNLLAAVHLGN